MFFSTPSRSSAARPGWSDSSCTAISLESGSRGSLFLEVAYRSEEERRTTRVIDEGEPERSVDHDRDRRRGGDHASGGGGRRGAFLVDLQVGLLDDLAQHAALA